MKAIVIKSFSDKYKKVIHKVGDVINVSKERFEEINNKAIYVEKVKKR